MDKLFRSITAKEIGTALLDMAMPRLCVVCSKELMLREKYICTGCLLDLPLTFFWRLSHNPMADKLNARIEENRDDRVEQYCYASALIFYNSESGYKQIPRHLKYKGGISSGRYFSRMFAEFLKESPLYSDVDMVIPVPLHWMRRWKRGYNQAEIIAAELASVLGSELRCDILKKKKFTRTQTRVVVENKYSNVRTSFSLNFRALSGCSPKHILLVDDTFTTGSTLASCIEQLRLQFVSGVRISAVTLAYVKV